MTAPILSEYGDVIRVNASLNYDVLRKDGYAFVSEQKPLAARQYCREMTLARGRILYEVWDHWDERVLGYIVPEEILHEAKAYRPTSALSPWPEEPEHVRTTLQHTYDRVTNLLPRIPAVAAKSVAEDLYHRFRRRPFTKRAIEDSVVVYVRHKWTSYDFRVTTMKQDEDEVVEMIKPRMREVLQSWLEPWVDRERLIGLWERCGLLDASEGKGEGRFEDVVMRGWKVCYFGGAEGIGNIRQAVTSRL